MPIRNLYLYLSAVVGQFREAVTGSADEFEAKKALWKAAVVIFEVADDPRPWLDQLRMIAVNLIKPNRIESTIRSAERKAMSNA